MRSGPDEHPGAGGVRRVRSVPRERGRVRPAVRRTAGGPTRTRRGRGRAAAERAGVGDGEPEVVLLHGGSQNAHTWDTVAMALRPRSLVAIDLPGHGHSDGPGERQRTDRTPTSAADDIAVVIRALAPERPRRGRACRTAGSPRSPSPRPRRSSCAGCCSSTCCPGSKREHARHIVDFVNGPATFRRFDDLLARTMEFNPTRSISSLRRGILHNAVQLDDGSWVWRHSRWRLGDAEQTQAIPEAPPAEAPCPRTCSTRSGASRSRCCWPVACGRTRCCATTTRPSSCGACHTRRSCTSRRPVTASRATCRGAGRHHPDVHPLNDLMRRPPRLTPASRAGSRSFSRYTIS